MDMTGKVLRVQMFGGFSMHYGDEIITMNKAGSSKSVRLLQMLLLSLESGIAKNELMDNLYGWNEKTDTANSNRNLNNLIYRLKGQLIACGLPEDEYVALNEGMCSFKSSICLELDTQQFEALIRQAGEKSGAERISLYTRANEMYCGELLPGNQTDMWFFNKSNYFKELYLQSIRELEREFLQNRDYKNRLQLYLRAAAVYPFDNWQTQLIRCNLEIYRYEEALEIYNNTMELYAREMGSPPAAEMQECFEGVELPDNHHSRDTGDPDSWKSMDKMFSGKKDEIRKAILAEEEAKGAYYCTYPSFVDYCRMVVRAKERNQFSAVLMFLTLSQRRKRSSQKQMNLQEQMLLLKEVIGDSLRIGDAFTRYGNRHFILMLIQTEKEACSAIFRRIERAYMRGSGKGDLWYYADMTRELGESMC